MVVYLNDCTFIDSMNEIRLNVASGEVAGDSHLLFSATTTFASCIALSNTGPGILIFAILSLFRYPSRECRDIFSFVLWC